MFIYRLYNDIIYFIVIIIVAAIILFIIFFKIALSCKYE